MARKFSRVRKPRIKIDCKSQETDHGKSSPTQSGQNPAESSADSQNISPDTEDGKRETTERDHEHRFVIESAESPDFHRGLRQSAELSHSLSHRPKILKRSTERNGKPVQCDSEPRGVGDGESGENFEKTTSQSLEQPPNSRLTPEHRDELVHGSAIDPELAISNCRSLAGEELFDYLYPRVPGKNGYGDKRYLNRGILSSEYQRYFKRCEDSIGWIFEAVNPETGKPSGYYRVKLDKGSALGEQWEKDADGNWQKLDKFAKYKSAKGSGIQIPFPVVPESIWNKCSEMSKVPKGESEHFWQWVEQNVPVPIALEEGGKKSMCTLSQGAVAIPLAGVTMWHKKGETKLHPDLERFAQPGRFFTIIFDNDVKRSTRRYVEKQQKKLAWELKRRGCEVRIGTVPRTAQGKGAIDDFVADGGDFWEVYRNAKSLDFWNLKQLKQLTYEPNQIINERYIPIDIAPPKDAQIIGLKSPTNTGKTHYISKVTEPYLKTGDRKVLLISHRIQLMIQSCMRIGIPAITESEGSKPTKDFVFGFGLCIDSLHPFSQARFDGADEQWYGAIVIMDEVNQLIHHLLTSDTCKSNRVKILDNLKALLKNVAKGGGEIILADAHLKDGSINFIKSLIESDKPIETWILENEYQDEDNLWDIYHFADKNPNNLIKTARQKLEKGEKLLFLTSGQKARSKTGTINLEKQFKKWIPELRILRIDSETVSDPEHPAFRATGNINEAIKGYDLVLASPTIETGVSIENPQFDAVFLISQGVQTCDSVRQFLARYRPNVPRYIWLKNIGLQKFGNGSSSLEGVIRGEKTKHAALIKLFSSYGNELTDEGIIQNRILTTWAENAAIINAEKTRHREQIIEDLLEDGHRIISFSSKEGTDEGVKKDLKQTRKESYSEYNQAVVKADDLEDSEYEELNKKAEKTRKQRLSVRKKAFNNSYCMTPTEEMLEKDDKGFYSKVRLHYFYSTGRDFVRETDTAKLDKSLEKSDGKLFLPDSNKIPEGNKIKALDFLKLNELLKQDELSNESPFCIELFEKIKYYLDAIKLTLEVDFKKQKTPIECIKRLLNLVGLTTVAIRKESHGSERLRIYCKPAPDFERNEKGKAIIRGGTAIPIMDEREEIFEAWRKRDLEFREVRLAETQEKKAAEAQLKQLQSEMTQAQFEPNPKINPEAQPEAQLESEPEPLPPEVLEAESLLQIAANYKDAETLESALIYGSDILKKAAELIFEKSAESFFWIIDQNRELKDAFA